jgi:hypothetical protein
MWASGPVAVLQSLGMSLRQDTESVYAFNTLLGVNF